MLVMSVKGNLSISKLADYKINQIGCYNIIFINLHH